MNYLAHGLRRLDGSPWRLAGTALPDWLRVLDRRLRIAPDRATAAARGDDAHAAGLALGVLDHVEDDRRFHTSAAFVAATHDVAALFGPLRDGFPGLRPSFVAHVLVEVLLDAALVHEDPSRLDRYYAALAGLRADDVERAAARMTPSPPAGLAPLVTRFVRARFVADYLTDDGVVRRLDQTFRRVRQPALGPALVALLPEARELVTSRARALLDVDQIEGVASDAPGGE